MQPSMSTASVRKALDSLAASQTSAKRIGRAGNANRFVSTKPPSSTAKARPQSSRDLLGFMNRREPFASDPTTDELRPTLDDEIKVPMRPAAYQTPRAEFARTGVQLQMEMAYRTFRALRDARLEPGMRTKAGVRQRL